MKLNNLIYSLILHAILIIVIIFSFSKKIIDQKNKELHVKVEISNSTQLAVIDDVKKAEEEQIIEPINDLNKDTQKDLPQEKDLPEKQEVKDLKTKSKKNKTKKPDLKKDQKKQSAKKTQQPKKIEQPQPKEIIEKPKETKLAEKNIEEIEPKKEQPPEFIEEKKDVEELQEKPDPDKKEIVEDNINQENLVDQKLLDLQQKHQQKEFLLAQKSIAGLGLTNREKFNLYTQIKSCFKRATSENNEESNENILVKINITRSGHINSDIDDLEAMIPYRENNKEQFIIAVKNAKRALELCNPLRGLPQDKYDVWREVILEFSQTKSKDNNE